MLVKDVMSKGIHSLNPNASIREAAELMSAANVGLLPVVDHGKVLGVVTDRDLVVRCLARDYPKNLPVREAMTSNPLELEESASLETALQLMANKKIGRILVHDANGKLTGVLSASDVAAILDQNHTTGKLMASLHKAHKSRTKSQVAHLI